MQRLMREHFDAVVIGGGPGGATAALLLARAGWTVAVVERKPFPRRKVCGEYLSATNLPLLDRLGIGAAFRRAAGPEVRRVGLFAGKAVLEADLPKVDAGWGRALGRESLDSLLLSNAAAAGAQILQPWSVVSLREADANYICTAIDKKSGQTRELSAPIVVAAHGAWEPGPLPTQPLRRRPRASDLLAFKAHFRHSSLPPDLMPLLAFPGGYGGMVHCDDGRVSLSFCIRRDRLTALREPGEEAGESVCRHIRASCRAVDEHLAGAVRDGSWLAAGPIRPGIRLRPRGGLFAVGNAAGEAHPVVAEGISMAMQAAGLVAQRLTDWRKRPRSRTKLTAVNADYIHAWKRAFGPRLLTAALVAQWAMRPAAVVPALPVLGRLPRILTWGARLSGKAARVVLG
jgi:flavin-dependent dehydrogenase